MRGRVLADHTVRYIFLPSFYPSSLPLLVVVPSYKVRFATCNPSTSIWQSLGTGVEGSIASRDSRKTYLVRSLILDPQAIQNLSVPRQQSGENPRTEYLFIWMRIVLATAAKKRNLCRE
jgi:hypothetical protein